MSVVRSLQKVGKVSMAQIQNANGSLGGQWLSAINIAEQTVMDHYPQVDAIQIAGAKAHQSHEVATHSNIISAKFLAGDTRVISGHIHMNGTIDYSSRARSGGGADLNTKTSGESSSKSGGSKSSGSKSGGSKSSGSKSGGSKSSGSKSGGSKSGATDLTWRKNEQTGYAEWWDGTNWVQGDWSDEYQKWYAYYNGQWYYW